MIRHLLTGIGVFWVAFVSAEGLDLSPYLIPDHHPAKVVLDRLALLPTDCLSEETLSARGFVSADLSQLKRRRHGIIVASHPDLEGYLIKSYPYHPSVTWQGEDLRKYLSRIDRARQIGAYIEEKGCEHLLVPTKWLYPVGAGHYLLVVDRMEILPGSDEGGPTLEAYQNINPQLLDELIPAILACEVGEAWPMNIPFTHDGKLAFVDTGWERYKPTHLFHTLGPSLNPGSLDYVRAIYHRWRENQRSDRIGAGGDR